MKTELDMKIDAALDAYLEHFGKPYPLGNGHSPTVEVFFAEIDKAIRTNKPVPEPEYEPDADY